MLTIVAHSLALCPLAGEPPAGHPPVFAARRHAAPLAEYDAVRKDLRNLLTVSQEFWPADYTNYAPFFVRLAWHNSGSYRNSDGRGGVDGARQRFDPERSWADNTNLDKARSLLWPIKQKYGLALSWGDLIILAGNTAIESMGGPVLGFCGGRIDDADGSESAGLGPTPEQVLTAPCPVNGTCKPPLGSTTIGLIYVNPEGPLGNPDPVGSALAVRDTFARMSMNDTETVALIGGGHSFGKTHGACPAGAGPSPKEDPRDPWPGKCGRGADAFTSGFEGPWTESPTKWDNKYFQYLSSFEYEAHVGPGGHYQWRVKGGDGPRAPAADGNGTQPVMMLTSDVSLTRDPAGAYGPIVKQYAASLPKLAFDFSHAWYKLTTRDMGPASRCVGPDVPPPQDWQFPLPPPPPPSALADFQEVAAELRPLLTGGAERSLLVRTAWACASTFRHTDYQGGCNGARLRFAPQREWESNRGVGAAFDLLAPLMRAHAARANGGALSWSDLLVLGAQTALQLGAPTAVRSLSFCGGRTDAADAGTREQRQAQTHLSPRVFANASDTALSVREAAGLLGLTSRELVALKQQVWRADGRPAALDNTYYTALLGKEWVEGDRGVFTAAGTNLTMVTTDLLLRWDAQWLAIAQEYASDEALFLDEFGAAWTKLMNADRYSGPAASACDAAPPKPPRVEAA